MADKRIRIILDSKDAEKNAKDLDKSVRGAGASADKAQFSFNKLASAIAAAIAVDKLKDYADAFTSVQNQIRRTTENQDQLNKSTEALLKISNETRTGIAETTELYTSLAVSTKALGYSQEQVFGITKTINNLFLESGKTAEESAGAIRQLGQALQSGALRGDEFNSIAEGAPGILRAIQLETGKTAGELRAFAATGGITAELLTKSLENYSPKAQEAADKTKVTFAQSLVVAKNNATFFVGSVNDAAGVTDTLAKKVIDLSESLASAENIQNFIIFFKQTSLVIDQTTENLKQFEEEFGLAGQVGSESIDFIGRAFRDFAPNVKAVVQIVAVEVASMIDKVSAKFKQFDDYLANFMDGDNAEKSLKNYENRINAITSAREDSITQIMLERDAVIQAAKDSASVKTAPATSNSNFRKKTTTTNAPTEAEVKAAKKAYGELLDVQSEFWDAVDAEGKSRDSASKEIKSAQDVTASLRIELDQRRQISEIYRDQELSNTDNVFAQQLAMQRAKQAEDLANVQAADAVNTQRREEQLRLALESKTLEESEKARIEQEYADQALIARQITEEQKVAIEEDGARQRERIRQLERDSTIATTLGLGDQLMTVGQNQSKKVFEIGKKAAIASALISTYQGIAKGVALGYPAAIPAVAAATLTGMAQVQKIRSTNYGSGGGGGGGTSSGSASGIGGDSGSTSAPTNNVETLPQQKKIYDLRGVKADDKISVSAMAALLEDDGAIVLIENAREDAARRNVIGVTAR